MSGRLKHGAPSVHPLGGEELRALRRLRCVEFSIGPETKGIETGTLLGRVGVPFSPTDFVGYPTEGYAFGDRGGRVASPKQPGASLQGRVERTPGSWGVAEIHLSANVPDHWLCPGEMRRPAVER